MSLSHIHQENNYSSEIVNYQLDQLLSDFEHIQKLTKIRGNDSPFLKCCTYCKIHHDYDSEHNLVVTQYTDSQFISDLISEHDTLYKICKWAHDSIEKQPIRDSMSPQDKAWSHILSKNYNEVYQYLSDEEECILNSLKPFGSGEKLFDFMELSKYQNENWVLTLELLQKATQRAPYDNNKLYLWATCQSVEWQSGISQFNEDLWLNVRAELFYKVMSKHNEIYPKMIKCINFGINKPFIQQPKFYELNCGYMNDEIDRIGKKFIIEIIKYITSKNNIFQFTQLIRDSLITLQAKTNDLKQAALRSVCYFNIALMISDLLDVDLDNEFHLLDLIKEIVELIEQEFIDRNTKLQYLIQLLSILNRQKAFQYFISTVCQNIIQSQGDSLRSLLNYLTDFQFDRDFITNLAFEQFPKLSPYQQNELLSKEFQIYFSQNSLQHQVNSLLPYIIENIENFKDTFRFLLKEYQSFLQQESEYFEVYIKEEIEQMLNYLKNKKIPPYWFAKYIQFILSNPNENQMQIFGIMEAIKLNDQLFINLSIKRELLAQLAKKLTSIKSFVNHLLQ
ncbi:unnamed protein product (macronuclear) [Paramecium tetraurelia]|uniref:Nuclear pore complex protein n=1 Tax=Paramecium tetraurelia TaxID=5888 RepID=A0D9D9_PARTE|nr:uncharacterized protein GSPATT00014586001 [Paramecium tetraurelia]CAK79656.1 unnamed protein product [Paramecium tetraurelia]|eukprot:XP_001447053.1 hypothetical protein (macronuclear) [Paramecium tetraurelia strain d4-2]